MSKESEPPYLFSRVLQQQHGGLKGDCSPATCSLCSSWLVGGQPYLPMNVSNIYARSLLASHSEHG